MTKEDLLKEMKECVGTKEPVEYFKYMTDILGMLLDRIDSLEKQLTGVKQQMTWIQTQSALSIQWEPRVASNMLSRQIDILREHKEVYEPEIEELKKAYSEDRVTQNYHDFCEFWSETLGWHPFISH